MRFYIMCMHINQLIREAKAILEQSNDIGLNSGISSQIKEIYARCRTMRETQQQTLNNPINQALNTEFTEVENKTHLIFLKTLKVEIANTYTSNLNHKEWSILVNLTRCLYNGDDSQTAHLVSELPESIRHLFYGNLWKVLGSPPHPYKIGEYAFLNTQNCRASTTDKLDAIVCSLSRGKSISLLSAIGDINRLQVLLSRDDEIDILFLYSAVSNAAKNGHLSCLQHLLSEGRQFLHNSLFFAVKEAAEHGHLNCLQYLLSQGWQISEEALEVAVASAAENDRLSCLQYLLSQGRQISEQALGAAVRMAASNGHLSCLQYLLSEGRQIEQDAFNAAVIVASSRGDYDIVHYLVSRGQLLTESARGSSITNAAGPRRNEICDMLRMLVTLPDDIAWEQPISTAFRMIISLEDIKENPVRVLQELSLNPLPNSFRLQEYPRAIDLGGVSKQVFSTLFMALRDQEKLNLNSDEIPYTPDENSIEIKEIYETLGKFYSHLINRNLDRTDKFVTGIVFSPHFFALVQQTLINPDDTRALIQVICDIRSEEPNDHMTPYFNLLQNPENQVMQETVSTLLTAIGEEGDPVSYAKILVLDPFLVAAKAFIKGANESNASDQLLSMLRELPPEEFSCQVQGLPLTNEAVLDSLTILDVHSTAAFLQHVEWLKEKITSADSVWLKKFIFTVTGVSILTSNRKLKIKGTSRDTGFEFEYHTCFNSLDLPREPMEKQAFLEALDASLLDPGYNIA